jgi:hypothetical protein
VRVELDRVIAPSWIVRRVELCGVVADERMTAPIGRGTETERARVTIVVNGRAEAKVCGRIAIAQRTNSASSPPSTQRSPRSMRVST